MSQIVANIIEIINAAIEVVLIFLYFSMLSKKKNKSKLFVTAVYIFSTSLLSIVVLTGLDSKILLLTSAIILYAVAAFVFKGTFLLKTLWVSIYLIIITVSEPIVIGILLIANVGVPNDFLEAGVGRYLGMFGTKVIYLWLITFTNRILKKKVRSLPIKYWILILVTPITSVFILELILRYVTIGSDIGIVSCGLTILGISYINIALFDFFEIYDNKIRLNYLEQLKQQEQENYKMLSLTHKNMKEFKHDIQNHFLVLNELLKQENYTEAVTYLSKLNTFVKSANVLCYTGNNAIDSLVNLKAALAKTLGIEFICKTNVVTEIKSDEMELCRIIGNSLDNAIEGCERFKSDCKHIVFSLNEKDDNIIILVSNSSDNVDIDCLASTKKELRFHGVGTQSIKSSVERLNGIIVFDYSDNLFKLMLMIPNESSCT